MANIHDRIAINMVSFLGAGLDEAASLWRDLGARRITLSSALLLGDQHDAVRTMVAEGGHAVETVSHLVASAALPQQAADWEEPRARLSAAIDRAAGIGAYQICMVTGGRGALDWEDAAALYAEIIAPCVAQAREAGVVLSIESTMPFYADHHLGTSLRDALTLSEIAGIGLCIDIFAGWTEAGLKATIERASPRTTGIQVSDYVYGDRAMPCRAVPGDGVIPLQRIFGWMLDCGFTGAFDIEFLGPRIEREGPYEALRRGADNVGAMLRALGI